MSCSMRRLLVIGVGCAVLLVALVSGALAAPAGQSYPPPQNNPPTSQPTADPSATVQVASNATFGSILVNSQGMTLYTLSSEGNGAFTCTGSCLGVWPALLLPAGTTPTAGAGVTGTIGVVTRPDGGTQVTYNGFPLYTYVGDSAPGDATGDGITSFGGTWHVVKLAAAPVTSPTPTATPSPTSGPLIQVAVNPTLGPILVDAAGDTLYYNTAEKGTTLVCTGSCLTVWPPLLLAAGATTPTSGLGITGTLSSISRPDGGQQVTYNNEPLYTFAHDSKPGDTNGEGIKAFGGVWHAAQVNATPLAATPARRLTIHITTTGGTVWGKVTVRYSFRHHVKRHSCARASCTFAIPSGFTLHLSQSPTNSSTWPFSRWLMHQSGSRTRPLKGRAPSFKFTRNSTLTAVYVLSGNQGGYQP